MARVAQRQEFWAIVVAEAQAGGQTLEQVAAKHSVTEAALTVGFTDLGRFAQAFRRELGCAPSAFQRAHARAIVA